MKKSFGQHLLTDTSYLKKIISLIDLSDKDEVLEIGAGTGNLTYELSKKVKNVYAVELERTILKQLYSNLKSANVKNVEVIESNFLKIDLKSIFKEKFKIIGNIPYNITTPILLKILGDWGAPADHLDLLEDVYLMVQLEVAERFVAKPSTKAYSPISILIQYYCKPEILFKVPKVAFYPPPKVDSAFVRFKPNKNRETISNPEIVGKVIRTAFQQRRKKVINSLEKLFSEKSRLKEIFDKLKLDENLRAENLSIKDFISLAEYLG